MWLVPTRPALSRFGGCTVAVRDLTHLRERPRNARKCQQNAEGVGFEPTEGLHPQRFSRPPHSTALPPLRGNKDKALAAV